MKLFKFPWSNDSIKNPIHKDIMNRFVYVILALMMMGIVIIIKAIHISIFESPKYRLSKNIKYDFEQALQKGCSYQDLKYIYDKKEGLMLIRFGL